MPKSSVKLMVVGGQATAAPLGPSLGPLGVNIGSVVNKINEVTKPFLGMKVPVTVMVDIESKQFDVQMGTPTTAALIAKELGLEKGSSTTGKEAIGDLKLDAIISIAKIKFQGRKIDTKSRVLQILGSCVSMGVSVDGENPKVAISKVQSGDLDQRLEELGGDSA